ncbi:hypothetical protein RQP50_21485 [Paenibacillus sp. chi10]|uniref:Uncharacterized protein n=1 Tax=Paenibacillus suaedae TaxID=3077233 RepID=A0AAJ2JXQ1_9BACL|nr:hypothetical protein [Paenibacillus sp. chi10]MDT8978813.1 hypothetical protein [Paenibacillus sp. chi10]
MSRYKMPIMIVALLLISGVLGNHVYQTRITYSLHDLVMDYRIYFSEEVYVRG